MGQSARAQARLIVTIALGLLVALVQPAAADPIVTLPEPGKGLLRIAEQGPGMFAVVGEVSGIGVLGADRLTTLPIYGAVEGAEPELGLARFGVVGVHTELPLAGLLRVDASEATRVDGSDFEDDPAATVNRFIDDAAIWYRRAVWAEVIVGKQKVPFSRFRQLDVALVAAGVPPFPTARIAPDRRWGAALHGDLGALSYALGAFEDSGALQVREGMTDPSIDGRALFAFHTEWTPRAPIGRDHLPTPRSDPWFDTARVSFGLGALYRVRGDGQPDRTDFSASGQLKWRHLAAIVELLVDEEGTLAPAGELSVLVTEKLSIFQRADYDAGNDYWSVGWGASYFATEDRRSKVSLYGWLRRNPDRDIPRDGVIVQLQAAL